MSCFMAQLRLFECTAATVWSRTDMLVAQTSSNVLDFDSREQLQRPAAVLPVFNKIVGPNLFYQNLKKRRGDASG
jgi:hypothetical protein